MAAACRALLETSMLRGSPKRLEVVFEVHYVDDDDGDDDDDDDDDDGDDDDDDGDHGDDHDDGTQNPDYVRTYTPT